MSNKTILIVREPDKDLPEQYIRSVVATYNSCGGYAIQAMKDAQPILISDRMDTGASLDAVTELLKAYTAHRILLTFSSLDKVEEKFLQPFDLTMDGRDDVLMSFGIEGEFPTLVEAGITPEANFSKKIMLPNLNKFVKYSGGDLAKFMAEIRDPTFVDQIMVRIGERGVYCFFPPVGEPIWLGKNTLGSVFPWGTVSNTLGYKEEAPKASGQQDVKVVKAQGNGWFDYKNKEAKASGPALPVDPPPIEVQPAAPVGIPDPGKTDTKIDAPPAPLNDPERKDLSAVPPPGGHWEYIPTGLSYKDRKNLVKRMTNCGHNMPVGWDQPNFRYWVVDYPSQAKDLPELKERLEQQKKDNTPKDMRHAEPRPVVKSGGQIAAEANLMVLTRDEKERSNASIIKITDRHGKEIPSPIDIQKAESKYPQWSGQFGVDAKRPDAWLPEDLAFYMQENGKGGFHMLLEYRRRAINAELALAAHTPKTVDTKTPDVEVSVTDAEKKTGTGGWGNWK